MVKDKVECAWEMGQNGKLSEQFSEGDVVAVERSATGWVE